MALFRNGKPNVKSLVRRGDTAALVHAAGYQDLVPAPGGGMVDRGAVVRKEAIVALAKLGPEAGADVVTTALSDHSDAVRLTAIRVLYARQQTTPLAAALAWLPRDQGHSRVLAMQALAELRRPDSAPALTAALVHARGDDPVDEEEAALLALLLEADESSEITGEVVEQLLMALADENDVVSERAEDLLTRIAPASIEGVISELKAGAAPHRAATVLARIKDTRALEPLMEALLHRDPRVRAESATALGELRDPAGVEALIQATRDSDHRVRAQAGSALDQLGMVALVVGVSSLVRPVLLEAVTRVDSTPALPGAQDAAPATNDDRPEEAAEDTNGSMPDQAPKATNGSTPDEAAEPATADLLERLFAAPSDLTESEGPHS
jgi:HEAT repeat protein